MEQTMLLAVLEAARQRGVTGKVTAHAMARATTRFGGSSLPEVTSALKNRRFSVLPDRECDRRNGSFRASVTLNDGRVVVVAMAPARRGAPLHSHRPVEVAVTTVWVDGESDFGGDLSHRGRGVSHAELAEVERRRAADRKVEAHIRATCPDSVFEMLRF
jgi:hypothetical protein